MEAVHRKHKKCYVTLFVLIWYVQFGSIISLTLYHHCYDFKKLSNNF